MSKIFLPGGRQQIETLESFVGIKNKHILIIGTNSEEIANRFIKKGCSKVQIIINDYDSLMNTRLILADNPAISIRLMDYDNTDFAEQTFDIVYAQASISSPNRKKIIKEIKRILKPQGILCVGENTKLINDCPAFVTNIWANANIEPLNNDSASKYFTERGFELIGEKDLSATLINFYENTADVLDDSLSKLSDSEKSFYKKLLNKISHESNAYLKLGADKFIGFKTFILKSC